MTALGNVIITLNIKQSEIADKLGISKAAVSMQAKKGIKTIRTAKKYAAVLKCQPFLLMDC